MYNAGSKYVLPQSHHPGNPNDSLACRGCGCGWGRGSEEQGGRASLQLVPPEQLFCTGSPRQQQCLCLQLLAPQLPHLTPDSFVFIHVSVPMRRGAVADVLLGLA